MIYSQNGEAITEMEGKEIVLLTMTSTSIDLKIATHFIEEKNSPLILKVIIPKELMNLCYPLEGITTVPKEYEIVFPLGTKLKVNKVERCEALSYHSPYTFMMVTSTLCDFDVTVNTSLKNIMGCQPSGGWGNGFQELSFPTLLKNSQLSTPYRKERFSFERFSNNIYFATPEDLVLKDLGIKEGGFPFYPYINYTIPSKIRKNNTDDVGYNKSKTILDILMQITDPKLKKEFEKVKRYKYRIYTKFQTYKENHKTVSKETIDKFLMKQRKQTYLPLLRKIKDTASSKLSTGAQ
jgi:hypothetical protein